MMKNNFYLAMVLLGLLSGCATQVTPAMNIYTLPPQWPKSYEFGAHGQATLPHTEKSAHPYVLKLAPVNTSRLYNATDMIYSDARYSESRYAYSRWSDTPAALLLSLFQSTLETNHHFSAVIPPASASKADLLLESTLFDFSQHLNADKNSTGVISIRFYLIDNSTRQVIQTRRFTTTAPAPTSDAEGAAAALNKAAVIISHDLVQWLAETVPAGDD